MENELKLKLINKNKFIDLLKKTIIVQQNLLLEILPNEYILTKTFDEDITVVKYLKEEFSSIFEILPDQTVPDTVMFFGIYNLPKLISILGFVSDNDTISLEYGQPKKIKKSKKDEEKQTELPDKYIEVDKVLVANKKLQFVLECAHVELFHYLSDEKLESISQSDEYTIKFQFSLDERKNILNIMQLDDPDGIIDIMYTPKGVIFKGSDWKYNADFEIFENKEDLKDKVTIKKKNFKVIDNEIYDVFVSDSSIIFKSIDTDNIVIVGTVEDINE